MPVIDAGRLIENRVEAIRAYHKMAGVPKAELDLSGGIDSAVMAMLLKLALGSKNIILVHSGFQTASSQTERAVNLAKALDIPLVNGDFKEPYDAIVNIILKGMLDAGIDMEEVGERCKADPTIEGSIRSTLRAPIGRAANRLFGGGIRHGTGNECEDRWLRFYQKGGDGEVDTNPLAMLSKTEVYQLAYALGHEMGVYHAVRPIIEAVPSPDLWGTGDAHSDEAEFLSWTGVPFTYGRIDPETGEITHIGTIERVSRFLDTEGLYPKGDVFSIEAVLFGDTGPSNWVAFVDKASYNDIFFGLGFGKVGDMLRAARKAEKQTRHKENPNIPTLGTRNELVEDGILTNELPKMNAANSAASTAKEAKS